MAPLIRVAIAVLGGDEIVLVWTRHHVLVDGWSAAQVFADVCERYAAIADGRRPGLPARRPFREYLRWLSEQNHRAAEDHWRRMLSGYSAPTPLPYDRQPVEAHQAESSASVWIELPVGESDRLHHLARRNGATTISQLGPNHLILN